MRTNLYVVKVESKGYFKAMRDPILFTPYKLSAQAMGEAKALKTVTTLESLFDGVKMEICGVRNI